MTGAREKAVRSRRPRFARQAAVLALVGAALLASCGDGGNTAEPAADASDTSDPETVATADPDSPCPDRDVEAVLAELAELPYEERLQVMEERATEEGAVLLYSGSDIDLQEDLVDGFNELYPDITYDYIRVTSEALSTRLLNETRAGRFFADVMETNAQSAQLVVDEGLVADHFGAVVPEGYPDKYVEDWYLTQTINPQVLAWNTDLVASDEAPAEWDDLLDPKWAGQIAITDSPDGFVAAMIETRGLDGAKEYLEALMANDLLIRDGHSATVELLGAGEFAISVENYAHHIPRALGDGAPLDFTAPNPTAANSSGPAILRCANNPYAAALLAHFLVSEDGAQIVADTGRISVHPDVELEYPELQPFLDSGTEMFENILVLDPEISTARIGPALELIVEVLFR